MTAVETEHTLPDEKGFALVAALALLAVLAAADAVLVLSQRRGRLPNGGVFVGVPQKRAGDASRNRRVSRLHKTPALLGPTEHVCLETRRWRGSTMRVCSALFLN